MLKQVLIENRLTTSVSLGGIEFSSYETRLCVRHGTSTEITPDMVLVFNLGSQNETQQERKALTTDLQSNPVELNQQQRHLILLFQAVQRTSQNQFD